MKKKKKFLTFLLALCLVMALVPMTAFAEETPSFGGGTGTQEDPWLITSQADLIALAEFLNSGNAETFDTENNSLEYMKSQFKFGELRKSGFVELLITF